MGARGSVKTTGEAQVQGLGRGQTAAVRLSVGLGVVVAGYGLAGSYVAVSDWQPGMMCRWLDAPTETSGGTRQAESRYRCRTAERDDARFAAPDWVWGVTGGVPRSASRPFQWTKNTDGPGIPRPICRRISGAG
jgi:hypothetical protein